MMFTRIFKKRDAPLAGRPLYERIVQQSRRAEFYLDMGVPDTVDGRFDLIVLHVFLVVFRLRDQGDAARKTTQDLFDVMFADLDRALREMGVGDMGIGKRIKRMAEAFYGRCQVYEAAAGADGDGAFADALKRNLYRNASPGDEQVGAMVDYVRRNLEDLQDQALDGILAGEIEFSDYRLP